LGVVSDKALAANAYTGMGGIVTALEHGADIVVCGRWCDASPVMGLAYWWHKRKISDYGELAGSLMDGHLIECGAYVTGENYCGFKEVEKLYRVGYPIAEIASDGAPIITKSESTNGTVTIDTTKAQLLYEIQGPYYLNPDVIAHINGAKLEEIAKIVSSCPESEDCLRHVQLSLRYASFGGYQAELSTHCVGIDVNGKVELNERPSPARARSGRIRRHRR
jgi:Acyclic terpene utilisation family protein AtuA